MKAISAGPNDGWHFHKDSYTWAYYRNGVCLYWMTLEAWEMWRASFR